MRYSIPLLALLLAPALAGCPNPNVYGTPRTTPEGELSHTIAPEVLGYTTEDTLFELTPDYDPPEGSSGASPIIPSYTLRVGTSDRTDLGFRLANASSLGIDAKYNFLRSDVVDLALDPAAQVVAHPIAYFHLPLIIGVNIDKTATVVLTPGASYGVARKPWPFYGLGGPGLYARLGAGINIRANERFAIQPELTALKHLDSDNTWIYLLGLGLTFGSLPDR